MHASVTCLRRNGLTDPDFDLILPAAANLSDWKLQVVKHCGVTHRRRCGPFVHEVGCIDHVEFAKSLRRTLREEPDSIFGKCAAKRRTR